MRVNLRDCLVVLICLCAVPAYAQFDTASVVGTVRDTSNAAMPGATVTLTSSETGVSLTRTTNGEGVYEFATVRPGAYVVTAEKSGFSVALVDNIAVQVGARQRIDLQMAVGQISEKLEVTAAAPLVETETSQRGQVISETAIRELPLNGREYSSLALLTTGVRQSALNKSTNSTPREGAFNVNGLRSVFNNFLIDGLDNNAYGTSNQGFSNQVMQPSPDAVREFRVVTNNQSAEYGRAAGATINVALRSGTNQLHGSGWEFFRDTKLNAAPHFLPPDGKKPPLRRNQFGGVLGGPIARDKAFFLLDYEGFRQDRRQAVFSTLPTAAQNSGVLSVDIQDPRTGLAYPAGTPIPMTPFARAVLGALPAPTSIGAANNYALSQLFTNHSNKADTKVDMVANASLSFFGRYGWRSLNTLDQPSFPLPAGGGGNGSIYARSKQLALGATFVARQQSLLEIRFGWGNTKGGKNPPGLGAPELVSIPGLPTDSRIAGGLNSQSVSGYTAFGRQATNPQWQYPTLWNPKVNYTWLAGRHSLKTGYEFQGISVQVQDVNPLYGLDSYTGQFTRPTGAAANNLYNLADFMLGLRSQYAISTLFVAEIRQQMHFTYLQDDVRVNDRLTVNAGLRYEYATPMWEAHNRLTNFDPVAVKMIGATDGSVANRALVNPDKNDFAPRLGFAYAPTPNTVVHGGWGVSYVHWDRIGSANLLAINAPQVIRAAVNQTDPAAASFRPTELGYPAGITDPSTFNPATALVSYIPKDYHSGYVHNWFASVQRQIGAGMLVDVAYVGNKASDLLLIGNLNQAAPNNSAGTIPLAARRPIPAFGDITYVFNGGRSRYDALQMKWEWRKGADLNLLSALTFSNAKDNAAQSLENNNGNFPAPQDLHNLTADYGTSAYHQPYNSTTSVVWMLPFGRGKAWGDWQVAGINTITPGEMVTFAYSPAAAFQVSGITNDFAGANNYRPNVTCDPYASSKSATGWFNPSCVTIPTDPSQPFGNAPRNSVRGPNYWTFDVALMKQLALTGAARLQLRLEAFNLFNRVNYTAPSGNRSTAAFGTITSTYDPRQMQLGVKVLW
ncbi:MAG TPA: carboxypeptidase regulatory-like domain-containing protein [Vicinamibacterales bacterium]|nr:carboxypeptidase regulatory-like domain-containing protein [Vicinamibacterales bacterium]